jgi:putative phosphoribosyl transferase
MKFKNRKHAGKLLADQLLAYASDHPIVLAIPRGGVEVGLQVAKRLDCDFDLIVVRKLPFPDNPESGFGAIAEDGSSVVFERFARTVPETERERIYADQKKEIENRINRLRKGRPLPEITGRTVILIDDGIAMGSTMQASVALCRNQNAKKIIVAAPVSSPRTKSEFQSLADDAVILTTPEFFQAVAQVYENWYDVSDEEVLELLDSFN